MLVVEENEHEHTPTYVYIRTYVKTWRVGLSSKMI